MELKTKYQYTYFIYPYIVTETKYEKYLLGLLRNKKCKLKYFEKERDLDIYNFFLPKVRSYLFRNFEFTKEKIKRFKEFDDKMQARIISKYPCISFEYELGKDVQAKAGKEDGIFFKVQKIEIICFNTGICFIILKTNIEESMRFSDVLNFNYKFKDSGSELKNLKNYEKIHIQTSDFSKVTNLMDLINTFVPNKKNLKNANLDANKFYTYAYTCIEQDYWNKNEEFDKIKNEFLKYMNFLKSSSNVVVTCNDKCIMNDLKYSKIGINQLGIALLCSACEKENYTKLPFAYENEYLYLYIWILYKKICLNKISKEFDKIENNTKVRKKFIKFTQSVWINEITNDEIGIELDKKISNQWEIQKLYQEVKNKYDIMYKEMKIEKNSKINRYIIVALIISLGVNIINFIGLLFLK